MRTFTHTAKIFVAGHNGLVGSAILRELQAQGYTNLITRSSSELDLRDQVATDAFFAAEKPEYVFLAAAKVWGIVANNTYPADFITRNLQIQTNVIHSAWKHGVAKLLFLGSSCIYPKLCPQPIKEEYIMTWPLEPTNDAYSIAKIAGIKMCQSFNRQYKTNFIACMPTNLYGPKDNFDLNGSHVMPAMIRKFHEAKIAGNTPVTLRGDGSPYREFLYVEDMARACIFLMKKFDPTPDQNERWDIFVNIGTGKDSTIYDLALLVQRIVGHTGEIIRDTTKPNWTPKKMLDTSRIEALWRRPEVSLEDGITRSYQWFLEYRNDHKVS